MTRKILVLSAVSVLAILMTACGSAALPAYDSDSTDVAVARTETREALFTQGAIIPTDTPTITPSPTVDFEATNAVIQATDDAIATVTAEFEATVAAEAAEAEAVAQAETADAQATLDAQPELFAEVSAADPVNGEALFIANAGSPCSTCHLVNSEDPLVGPGQLNVFARVVERIENGEIEEDSPYVYLYNSIVHPNDYLTLNSDGVAYPAAMPLVYGDFLTDAEIYDLIAYLVTLEG
ncbi:MAG: hypothetical protein Phog2KO_06010 [Phototrophicaceae bacterium]